jgi:hypothetical protein
MSLWLGEKIHLKKKSGLNRVLLGHPGHGSTGFLLILIFCLTTTCPATRSTRSQVDPSDRFGFNNYDYDQWLEGHKL